MSGAVDRLHCRAGASSPPTSPAHRPAALRTPTALKKQATPKSPRNLDKHLFEAGQQCQKRLWLDYHEPVETESPSTRRAMSEVGQQLLTLARSVFPKGVAVVGKTIAKAAEATKEQIAAATPVLFGATFVADGIEVQSDILVLHKDGQVDLYEVKSGTKVKHRYVNDLALQVHVVEQCGLVVRAAFLLHVNPKYVHKEGADFPPMQLLRSADITTKVRKQVEQVRVRLPHFRTAVADDAVLALPMGTYCSIPFPCPHLARCRKEGPALPLRELPELTRAQELELHKEGVEDLASLDQKRPGLTFKQRRTLACLQEGKPIVEPFVREELRQCAQPLHFLAIGTLTEPLPRFEGQRPWRQVPYVWAVHTLHKDGRIEIASFAHADKTDPRPEFAATLGKHLEIGGSLLVWNDESLEGLRALLEDLPTAKASVRAIVGRQHFDLMKLLDSGVFHPKLRGHEVLATSVAAILEDESARKQPLQNEDELREALEKACAPRVRSATKEKIAADLKAAFTWQSEQLLKLYRTLAGVEAQPAKPAAPAPKPQKALPKPLPKP